MADVRTRGGRAEEQLLADLLVAEPLSHQDEDLAFALCQHGQAVLGDLSGDPLGGELGDQAPGDARREEGVTGRYGKLVDKGYIYKLLNNRTYIGKAVHKGTVYSGEHEAIISQALWDKVRSILDSGAEICTAVDNSCLLQIGGALSRTGAGVRTVHLAEILASEAA